MTQSNITVLAVLIGFIAFMAVLIILIDFFLRHRRDRRASRMDELEGHDFVTGNMVLEIDLDVDGNTGFFTPFWKMDARTTVNADGSKTHNIEGAEVFKQFSVGDNPNSQMDIGGVKALLLA